MRTIDVNCDLGEEPQAWGRDLELLDLVTSANLACGGHAGDEATMRRAARAAAERGVAVGAHPSYPEREHFGRRELELEPAQLVESLVLQIGGLRDAAAAEGVALRHVKPHGALYNRAARDRRVAAAVGEAVRRIDRGLLLFGLAGSPALADWRETGLQTIAEAFADRRYEPDGSLRSRARFDAVISDPAAAAQQAARIALEGWTEAAGGGRVEIEAQSLCIHSDTPGALAVARAVRRALDGAGVQVSSPPAPR